MPTRGRRASAAGAHSNWTRTGCTAPTSARKRALGIGKTSFYKKLREHDLGRGEGAAEA
ncbi:MAG TPA: hypothetical protein VN581_04635 [Patescibacteria group bacterium]|nr:hypothetical protein [Patescibacteria group bacterium]